MKVGQQLGKSRIIIERWSAAHHWQERIREHEQRITEQVAAEEAEERKRARKQRLQVARGARSRGVEALTQLNPADLARLPLAVIRLLEYADNTERRDLGEPDKRVEVGGRDGGVIEFTIAIGEPPGAARDLSQATDDRRPATSVDVDAMSRADRNRRSPHDDNDNANGHHAHDHAWTGALRA